MRGVNHEGPRYAVFSSLPYVFLLRPKHRPQDYVLAHPRPLFFPKSERQSFTPILNISQNYGYVYFNLCTFWLQKGR